MLRRIACLFSISRGSVNVSSLGTTGEEVGESGILWVCVSGLFHNGDRMVALWAVAPREGWGLLEHQPEGCSAEQQTEPVPAVERNQPPCTWRENGAQAQLCLPPPQTQTGSLSASSCLTE